MPMDAADAFEEACRKRGAPAAPETPAAAAPEVAPAAGGGGKAKSKSKGANAKGGMKAGFLNGGA